MIKRLIIIASILFTVTSTAQEGTSSPYSFYGLGLTTFKGTVVNRSMGGLSIFSDSIHLNLQNPAAYGGLGLTTYSVGGTHSVLNIKNSTDSERATVTSLDYLAVGIPAGKFGFGFGLLPYTSVGYDIISIEEDAGISRSFSGSGGVNKVFLSAGLKLSDNFSFGAGVDYNFGSIENKNILIRQGIQYGTREINRSVLSGFNFNFGLDYQQMIGEDLQLKASTLYTTETGLTSKNERELAAVTFLGSGQEAFADMRDIPLSDTEMRLPSKLTFGGGIGQPRKWFVGAEYSSVGESNFNNRSFELEGADYTEASQYRIGGFYIPDYNSLTSYFERIVFRGGLRMEETGLELNGEAIKEFGISFGVGLPVGRIFSNANLGFEYGQRGTTDSGLIQENFFNISIGLSLNDRWFIQRKFE